MATEEETGSDTRTLALSDGVFAIALTLLVLAIHLPVVKPGETLARALLDRGDELKSWLLSFVVLAAAWARHRKLFAALRGVDPTITWLNLAYLGVVAFVPAGTP
jgi:uncharacterized membrane protein